MRWPAAVKALSIAIDEEVVLAPSMRVNWIKCVLESTMAMFMGRLRVRACWRIFWVRAWAAGRVRVGVEERRAEGGGEGSEGIMMGVQGAIVR
jgi:hypothetical protein